MDIKAAAILGSTGSIGVQSLDVARRLGIKIEALSAKSNIKRLESQIREFSPAVAAVADEAAARDLKIRVRDLPVRILPGPEGVCEAAAGTGADMVLNAVVGMAGLRPTLASLKARKKLALANKESLVTGGRLVMEEARKAGIRILPVDSEHSAIFQSLQGSPNPAVEIRRLLLTASGGPFCGMGRDELKKVTPAQALRHPNWNMGAKITVDSATMMNKGLELIEAHWLFGIEPSRIKILIHRESILHSAVEFADGAVIGQMGVPDMRIPIQYALTYPNRVPSPAASLDLIGAGRLTFAEPDEETFKCLRVCRRAIAQGGLVPAAANGANEEAVALFLSGKIGFLEIGELVESAAARQKPGTEFTLEAIEEADREARRYVLEQTASRFPA